VKTIGNLYDGLRPYGINPLTGEACPYSQRVLCDLTPRGKKIVFDLLGIPPTIPLSENWNSGSSFSMMLPRSLLSHDLPIWCLIDSGCDDIIVSSDGICGRQAYDTDEDWENYYQLLVQWNKNPFRVRSTSGPRQGTRMIHAMSGRAS
jgi:hypothetical protein